MKNSLILIYLVFAGFVSFNNNLITEKGYNNEYHLQNIKDSSSHLVFDQLLPARKSNHKLNHSENSKLDLAYLNDAANINEIVIYPSFYSYPYKYMELGNHNNFYNIDKFLPIFTQSDKTIQAEFLII